MDQYEYGMYGKIFQYDYEKDHKVYVITLDAVCAAAHIAPSSVFASFGGLLMLLQSEQRLLVNLELDQHIFLLVKKT